MTEPTITCPSCHAEIKLTESLAAPLIEATRRDFERQAALKEADIAKREKTLAEAQRALKKSEESVQEQVAAKLKEERGQIAAEEAKKARLMAAGDLEQKTKELADLEKVLEDRNAKLTEARNAQAELLRKERELDDAKREMELTIEKRVQSVAGDIHQKARQEAEEGLNLKIVEKEQTIASMRLQIDDLKKKAEQGSQQLQGEALELQLEAVLRESFPRDIIEPVPKGEFGGDILQQVVGDAGQVCGTILWETKQTKNWSDGWLVKLKGDQRAAKADLAVLVSQAVPAHIESFDLHEDVWVTKRQCVKPVAAALRHSLMEIALARGAATGQKTKAERLYAYCTGPHFRHRMNAWVEAFTQMQKDLLAERKAITKIWAKREKQINGIQETLAGMYGDLQGVAGTDVLEIQALDIMTLADQAGADEDGDSEA